MNATPETPNDREEPVDGVAAPGTDAPETVVEPTSTETVLPVDTSTGSSSSEPAAADGASAEGTAAAGVAQSRISAEAPVTSEAPVASDGPAVSESPVSEGARATSGSVPTSAPAPHEQQSPQVLSGHQTAFTGAPTGGPQVSVQTGAAPTEHPASGAQTNGAQTNGAQTAGAQAPGAPTTPTYASTEQTPAGPQPNPYAGTPGSAQHGGGGATGEGDKKKSSLVPVFAALAVGALVGGATGGGIAAAVVGADNGTGSAEQGASPTITVNDTESVNQVTAVAAKAGPSVVTIQVAGQSASGSGSGIILSDDGYVLTNTHVVTLDGASAGATVEVSSYDGKLYSAEIVGTDPTTDLAVIKLVDASDLTPIEWADSDDLNVGDTSIAIGAPLGLSNTVTDGIVSALNRSIQIASSAAPENEDTERTPENPGQDSPFDFWGFGQGQEQAPQASSTISIPVVQTDAAINPGNSGGALVDDEGRLIGVNVAIASTGSSSAASQSGSIGVGFAVPSNVAKRISDELIANGVATHGLLGASVRDATSADGSVSGALIAEAPVAGGAAAEAGLREGDVVTEFNGKPITSSTDLTAQVRSLAPGETAELTYVRGERSAEVDVTLGSLEGA